jgi:hypothetical protein
MAGLDPIGCCTTRSRGTEQLSNPKFMDIRDPEVQEPMRAGDVASGRGHRSIPDPLLDGIRPTGKHDVDAAFQFVLVGAQTHQPHRDDLIKVRGPAKKMGKEQLVPSSK